MLDRVRHIDLIAVDPGLVERLVEHASRGTHERMPGDVFLVSRLLADEHHFGARPTFAEHRLRCVAPQIATATLVDRATQTGERAFTRGEFDRRHASKHLRLTLSGNERKTAVHDKRDGRKMVANIDKCRMNVPYTINRGPKCPLRHAMPSDGCLMLIGTAEAAG